MSLKSTLILSFLLTKINLKKNLTNITLNYHISAIFHTISKWNVRDFGKNFVKKILILSYFLIHSKLKIAFHIKNQFLMIWSLSWYINLLVLAVVLAILAKLVVMLKLGLRSKKDNKSHIFKHLNSTQTCFDSYNSLCFKIIDNADSKFDLKIKEPLYINWRKPNLNAQQNHLALTFSL